MHLFNISCDVVGMMAVVKLDGASQLCKTDEVGELCLSAPYAGTGYFGLQGVSNAQFKVCTVYYRVKAAILTPKIRCQNDGAAI